MIRPLRDEVERYGHFSLAAESMYDHPFQWGSKRTGPDLARVGGKYSDEWHVQHMMDPRSVVPESIMPPYRFLASAELGTREIEDTMRVSMIVGVPYTEEQIASAKCGHGRAGRSQFRRRRGGGGTLPESGRAGFRRRSGETDRDGCARRLSPRCWAPWSIFRPMRPRTRRTCAEGERLMTYETLSSFAQTWGLLYFAGLFGLACLYALWPSNKRMFDRAPALLSIMETVHEQGGTATRSAARDDRPRMGRDQGAEHATAEMVAEHLLRDGRRRGRLLGPVPAWPLISSNTPGILGHSDAPMWRPISANSTRCARRISRS